MDLEFTPAEEAFREEVRAFYATQLPARLAEKIRLGRHLDKHEQEEWHAILNRRGWLVPHWPTEWGGTGWSVVERYIFDLESSLANAPRVLPFGVNMLAPVLLKYGSEAQKAHWLPRMLDGSDWWDRERSNRSTIHLVRHAALDQGCCLRDGRQPTIGMRGMRSIRGSVNTSSSSRLVLENSDTTAPSAPAWNQCSVSGGIVNCSPGPSTISWKTV